MRPLSDPHVTPWTQPIRNVQVAVYVGSSAQEEHSKHIGCLRCIYREKLCAKVEDCKWKTIFCGHYRSVFNHYDVIGQQSNRIRWENAKEGLLRRWRSFKVIEVGINRKPVCDFLLVINSNWHHISCRFGVIAAYCSNFGHFAFLSHPLGGLETTYDVHHGLIGKRIVDFPLVLLC